MGFCKLALAKALALDWAKGEFHPGLPAAAGSTSVAEPQIPRLLDSITESRFEGWS